MKRSALIVLTCLVSVVLIGAAIAADVDQGPAIIKIDVNQSKKAVEKFDHQKHQGLAPLKDKCTECHHTSKAGEKIKKCGECHKEKKDPATKALGFKDAFHKQCQDCHKKQKDKPELKLCKSCHGK